MDLYAHAQTTFPKPDHVTVIKHEDGNTQDIIDTIMFADSQLGNSLKRFASVIPKTMKGLYTIWAFVHDNIKYVADRPGKEKVKDPAVTWHDRFGDCKSFSLMIGGILKAMGVPYKYRFTAYKGTDPTHIYVIAKMDNRNVIMDATIDRFDYEVPFLKKYDKMTKIAYLTGTGSTASSTSRILDAPLKKTPMPYIDYTNLTEGQLTLRLLDEQAKILSNYYGDPNGNFQKARNLIYQYSKNLHYSPAHVGHIGSTFNGLMEYIEWAKYANRPAGGQSYVSGIEEDTKAMKQYCKQLRANYWRWAKSDVQDTPAYWPDGSIVLKADLKKFAEEFRNCEDKTFFLDVYNKHLEKTAPHILYEFIPDPELNSLPSTANFKANNHRLANSVLSRYSHIDRTNIVLWNRNGVMRAGTEKKLSDITPEGMIAAWRKQDTHIGIDPVTITAIASIIVAAIGGATALALAIQEKKGAFLSELEGFGSDEYGPGNNDFIGGKNSSDLMKYLPFAGLALGSIFLLNNK